MQLIFGWGINDADYNVYKTGYVDGKRKVLSRCPYYVKWSSIVERAKSAKCKSKNPAYVDANITDDWKYFSDFIKWVDSQPNRDWQNCEPDKDLLGKGEKLYSPNTVVFISKTLNNFLRDERETKYGYMKGCSFNKRLGKFTATCSPVLDVRDVNYLGVFNTEVEAHLAWKAKKHEYACMLAEKETDPRIITALKTRYL
jgi:hypothetical protein